PPVDGIVAAADRRLFRRPRPQHRPARLPEDRAGPGARRHPERSSAAAPCGFGMTQPGGKPVAHSMTLRCPASRGFSLSAPIAERPAFLDVAQRERDEGATAFPQRGNVLKRRHSMGLRPETANCQRKLDALQYCCWV